jgi:hypothetical protein
VKRLLDRISFSFTNFGHLVSKLQADCALRARTVADCASARPQLYRSEIDAPSMNERIVGGPALAQTFAMW